MAHSITLRNGKSQTKNWVVNKLTSQRTHLRKVIHFEWYCKFTSLPHFLLSIYHYVYNFLHHKNGILEYNNKLNISTTKIVHLKNYLMSI